MKGRLQQHWKNILAAFFPRWKASDQWKCKIYRNPMASCGICNVEKRRIEICFVSKDDDELDLLLIHELSHAVASVGHGKMWQRRISRAAETARKLGRIKLAALLDSEIETYQDGRSVADIYREVSKTVSEMPSLSFMDIKQYVARSYGLVLSKVSEHFPRLRAVFEKAAKGMEAEAIARGHSNLKNSSAESRDSAEENAPRGNPPG